MNIQKEINSLGKEQWVPEPLCLPPDSPENSNSDFSCN